MSETTFEMTFDLSVREVPVTIGDVKYVLREATEDAVRLARNSMLEGLKLGPEGKLQTVRGAADQDSLLVGNCLFRLKEDGKTPFEMPVGTQEVRKLPRRVVKPLADKVKEISEMDKEEGDDAAKNEPSDTIDGSG